jgi:hypothetical protein
MYWDVTRVYPLPSYRLYVELRGGKNGVFDVTPYMNKGELRRLADVNYFNRVGIVMGAITWPDDQDIAPETLLSELLPVNDSDLALLSTAGLELSYGADGAH